MNWQLLGQIQLNKVESSMSCSMFFYYLFTLPYSIYSMHVEMWIIMLSHYTLNIEAPSLNSLSYDQSLPVDQQTCLFLVLKKVDRNIILQL